MVASLVYKIKQRWDKKKLIVILFIDIKRAFDHVLKTQLVVQMLELEINRDLIYWIKLFLTNRKLQLVKDSHNNLEKKVETGIPQGSPICLILFLIYINKVFEQVEKNLPKIVSLLFVDILDFIMSKMLIKEIAKVLEKVGNLIIKRGGKIAITYTTAKTKLIMF